MKSCRMKKPKKLIKKTTLKEPEATREAARTNARNARANYKAVMAKSMEEDERSEDYVRRLFS